MITIRIVEIVATSSALGRAQDIGVVDIKNHCLSWVNSRTTYRFSF
jgi:hypothetical protein